MTHLRTISAYTECYRVHSIKSLLVKFTRVSVVLKFLVFSNFFQTIFLQQHVVQRIYRYFLIYIKEDELNIHLDTFLPILEQHTEEPPLSIIRLLAFIGRYAVHSLYKKSKKKCPDCLIFPILHISERDST